MTTKSKKIEAPILEGDYQDVLAIWNPKRGNGEGYAVGREDKEFDELADELDAKLMYAWKLDGGLALYLDDCGRWIAVAGDEYGPWAIVMQEDDSDAGLIGFGDHPEEREGFDEACQAEWARLAEDDSE